MPETSNLTFHHNVIKEHLMLSNVQSDQVFSMVSITLPAKMHEEIDALIKVGYYDNRSELIRDALRDFFTRKGKMRLVSAVELYKDGGITLSRAAEIAGVSFERIKTILEDEGILERGRGAGVKDVSEMTPDS